MGILRKTFNVSERRMKMIANNNNNNNEKKETKKSVNRVAFALPHPNLFLNDADRPAILLHRYGDHERKSHTRTHTH